MSTKHSSDTNGKQKFIKELYTDNKTASLFIQGEKDIHKKACRNNI